MQVTLSGPWVIREEIELARPEPRVIRWVGRPVPLPGGIGQLVTITDLTSDVAVLSQRWAT